VIIEPLEQGDRAPELACLEFHGRFSSRSSRLSFAALSWWASVVSRLTVSQEHVDGLFGQAAPALSTAALRDLLVN
jgi:hypothetical protein